MALRHLMDGSNLQLVHNLTQQMWVIFNPMLDQIGRMMEVFGILLVQTRQIPLRWNVVQVDPSKEELPQINQYHPARF